MGNGVAAYHDIDRRREEGASSLDLTHVSLFSGIGGMDLAAEWTGFRNVFHCEIGPFCQAVLRKHWREVPIHGDIRTLSAAIIRDYGIEGCTVLSGGFPCQPFSIAGKRRGTEDSRDLWPEMRRVISLIRPRWIIGENVANFVNMELDRTCTDLEAEGYEVGEPLVFPASAIGADHTRYRTFVIAHDNRLRIQGEFTETVLGECILSGSENVRRITPIGTRRNIHSPRLCRPCDGIPDWMDRLRAAGNAVMPQQVYPIFAAIAAIERLSYAQQEEAA